VAVLLPAEATERIIMATCDMGFDHEEAAVIPDPEPVVVDPGPNENDVKIAEIEAEASIERERIWTEQQENELAQQNEALRGELRGIRETLATLMPSEPETPDEPVVVPVPAAGPDELVGAPPETEPVKKESNSGGGWWDNYK
jgi:hypothetical protein